jgi:3-oxoadipate enol-lactonase
MPAVEVFGGTLHYVTSGDRRAPAVLLLHALGSALDMWDAQAASFSDRFHVIRYSTRGHGASTCESFCELDLDALARDALAVLDAVRVERAHWVGLSLGGMTALQTAHAAPERVARLVVANTAAFLPPREAWEDRIRLALAGELASLADTVMGRWFTEAFRRTQPETVERIRRIFVGTSSAGYASACAAIRDMDLRAHLPSIAARTLVIAGTADTSTPPSHAEAIASAIPGAALLRLPAAHLSNVECGNAFTSAVRNALAVGGDDQATG